MTPADVVDHLSGKDQSHSGLSLIDIGVNLTSSQFAQDRDDVVARARQHGIVAQLVTGTNLASSKEALAYVKNQPDLFSTCGFHPHHASEFTPDALNQLKELAAHPKVRAIGETGLDFNRNFSPRHQQEFAFNEQLQLAAALKKPLFLHQRDAHDTFIALLKNQHSRLQNISMVVHCFTDTLSALRDCLDLGCHIGITGWICDKKRGEALRQIVQYIPDDRLLIETDAPYLLPHNLEEVMSLKPTVKKRNEPACLYAVLVQVAQCRSQSVGQVAAITYENALDFMQLKQHTSMA